MQNFHSPADLRKLLRLVIVEHLRPGTRGTSPGRERIRGAFPPPGSDGVLFGACDDVYYARFALPFLLSIESTGCAHSVHIHLYSPSRETLEHAEALKSALTCTRLSYTWEEADLRPAALDSRIYFTAARFLVVPHLLRSCRAPVVCVDIDGLVRRPLAPVFDIVRSGDAAFHFRLRKKKPWKRLLAGVLGVNPTRQGLRFFDRTAAAIAKALHLGLDFYVDQIVLYYSYRVQRTLRFWTRWRDLPKSFIDVEFDQDSFIWTAKGPLKHSEAFSGHIGALEEKYAALRRTLPSLGPIGEAARG